MSKVYTSAMPSVGMTRVTCEDHAASVSFDGGATALADAAGSVKYTTMPASHAVALKDIRMRRTGSGPRFCTAKATPVVNDDTNGGVSVEAASVRVGASTYTLGGVAKMGGGGGDHGGEMGYLGPAGAIGGAGGVGGVKGAVGDGGGGQYTV